MIFGNNNEEKGINLENQPTILVVDDSPIDRRILVKSLTKQNYNVITAENGREGFQMAKEHKPDLILSDCMMPDIDGVKLVKMLHLDNETENIPLVFLTSDDSPSNLIECFDLGAENYLSKPINTKIITNQVKEILEEYLHKK